MTEKQNEELYALLSKLIFKYTSGESSSVPVEAAERILHSIEYCIKGYQKSYQYPAMYGLKEDVGKYPSNLQEESLTKLYELGYEAEKRCFELTKELWNKVKKSVINVDNLAYHDTIFKGIEPFFLQYDLRFSANFTQGDIDYPLAVDVKELEGVEFMYEYLHRLYLENMFLQQFDSMQIDRLLKGYHEDAKVYLLNIFEVVLNNVLGKSLLGEDIHELNITLKERELLYEKLKEKSLVELSQIFEQQVGVILEQLGITSKEALSAEIEDYVTTKIKHETYRIRQNITRNSLEHTFVSFNTENVSKPVYMEGELMPDEELRELIEELRDMTYLKDKLMLVREKVHSLSDLKEILGECFAGEEYYSVFRLLSAQEVSVLLQLAKDNLTFYEDENLLKEWERALICFEEGK